MIFFILPYYSIWGLNTPYSCYLSRRISGKISSALNITAFMLNHQDSHKVQYSDNKYVIGKLVYMLVAGIYAFY